MKVVFTMLVALSCAGFFSYPAQAEEQENYESDARYAENQPPTIPHAFKDTADGEYCLKCHLAGLNGAPQSPHPGRITCTECHVQGEIKAHTPTTKIRIKD